MHRLLRERLLITFGILILCIASGCFPDDDFEDDEYEEVCHPLYPEEDELPPSATVVEVIPPPHATLAPDQAFNLKFDQGVVAALVNGYVATGSGLNWTVSPALSDGVLFFNIMWENRDGSTGYQDVGPYFFSSPDVPPPVIVGGTVRDRDRNVDPVPVNLVGFRLDFNEPITGTIKLTDEAGNNLNWIANVVDWTVTLTPVAGQELGNGTTYKIEIDVQDDAGNPLVTTITFVTKPK